MGDTIAVQGYKGKEARRNSIGASGSEEEERRRPLDRGGRLAIVIDFGEEEGGFEGEGMCGFLMTGK